MKKRGRSGGRARVVQAKASKSRFHKPASERGHKTVVTPPAERQDSEIERLARELAKLHEQQTATANVLKVISRSSGDLAPVFDALLQSAVPICEAQLGILAIFEGNRMSVVATLNLPPAFDELLRHRGAQTPEPGTALDKMWQAKQVIHTIDDLDSPRPSMPTRLAGARTHLSVPMVKESELVGALIIYRTEVKPFTEKQIEVVQSFAAQAVIAIENARLLSELRQRTDELTEALEKQTATAEVLRIISGSPESLEPVFRAILENAVRLCEARFGILFQCEGEMFRAVALHNVPQSLVELHQRTPEIRPAPGTSLGRVYRTKRTVQIDDIQVDPVYRDQADRRGLVDTRTLLSVPMLRENELVGTISIYRDEVQPFSDKQIALVENFANQAVIAIENIRLTVQVRSQTAELEAWNRTLEERVSQQVSEIERMARLKRFLSPQVADLILGSGDDRVLESHRRDVTVVFCDLRGFTAFAETSEPEEVMATLREYHASVGVLIHQFEGTVERFAGDGLMIMFNDPLPCPDPCRRAVEMAVEMRACVSALTTKWQNLGFNLGFGVGIAYGYATLGRIGFEGRFDYSAIGSVTNLAARLCGAARGGQILIDSRVRAATEGIAEFEPLEELMLEGFHRPIRAFNVTKLNS